jgi:hypothetical protein
MSVRPISVAAPSKAWVCARSFGGIASSNSAGSFFFFFFYWVPVAGATVCTAAMLAYFTIPALEVNTCTARRPHAYNDAGDP